MFITLYTQTTGTGLDDRLCRIAFKAEQVQIANELFNSGTPTFIRNVVTRNRFDITLKMEPTA